jgi:ribonucleoside-diphosphate reductase alpha chain
MTAAALVHNGGKRKGAVCAYLETWHVDIEEFLDLRKNTGDDRRRCHDMNTANWVPDLFMKRVAEDGMWSLFSRTRRRTCTTSWARPSSRPTPPTRNAASAATCASTSASRPSTCGARCWPCCSRPATPGSPSRTPATCATPTSTSGQVHSSNLCTEITLHTNDQEIAVCNLGSSTWPTTSANGLDTASSKRPSAPPCACSTTSSTTTSTTCPRRASPTCATARWAWGSWASRTRCTSSASPTPAPTPCSSPTRAWSA